LSKKAGGLGLCKSKEDKSIFKDKTDRDYQGMLEALRKGHRYLTAHPRVDMIGELKSIKESALAGASWIWHPDENGAVRAPAGTRYFRRVIQMRPATLSSADIMITADNSYTLWVNGQRVLKDDNWTQSESASIKEHLTSGANVLAIVVGNTKVGPAGLIAAIKMKDKAGKVQVIVTDKSWVVGKSEVQGWRTDAQNPDGWAPARVMGKATMSPWQLK
jgi:alpha-L-rhamnosidase